MELINKLQESWKDVKSSFLICEKEQLTFQDLLDEKPINLSEIENGDVVSFVGDFNSSTIITLLRLIEKNVILVPLTEETANQHKYFYEESFSNVLIKNNVITKSKKRKHLLLETLRNKNRPGLILFSTGTTGKPKAILHDFTFFLNRYKTPRPAYKTLNFLLFDHIGGINTLFHTLFNVGTIISIKERTVENVMLTCEKFNVEVLPTTPTFLRMLLFSKIIPKKFPSSIKIITYGTEMMDQNTLTQLSQTLPNVDFRQTYGLSEIGIVRAKSKKRDSLYMNIGGEGVETKVINNVLFIKSKYQMLGYLNSSSPFDNKGWYNTQDLVDQDGDYLKFIGRTNEVINVGGLKFMAIDVEKVALEYPNIYLAKVISKKNPITGQHVEIKVQPNATSDINKKELSDFLTKKLPSHMVPRRIVIENIPIGHRFKKL